VCLANLLAELNECAQIEEPKEMPDRSEE